MKVWRKVQNPLRAHEFSYIYISDTGTRDDHGHGPPRVSEK